MVITETSAEQQQQETELLHILVGEYLAAGFTNGEILGHLRLDHSLTLEQAKKALRGVYDSWTSVREGLNIEAEDDRNWHIQLRMKLLQDAIKDITTPSRRLALMVLDSLANIQGISTIPEQAVPLVIQLVEKQKEPASEPEPKPEKPKETQDE